MIWSEDLPLAYRRVYAARRATTNVGILDGGLQLSDLSSTGMIDLGYVLTLVRESLCPADGHLLHLRSPRHIPFGDQRRRAHRTTYVYVNFTGTDVALGIKITQVG